MLTHQDRERHCLLVGKEEFCPGCLFEGLFFGGAGFFCGLIKSNSDYRLHAHLWLLSGLLPARQLAGLSEAAGSGPDAALAAGQVRGHPPSSRESRANDWGAGAAVNFPIDMLSTANGFEKSGAKGQEQQEYGGKESERGRGVRDIRRGSLRNGVLLTIGD